MSARQSTTDDEIGIFARLAAKARLPRSVVPLNERIAEEQRAARGQSRDARKTGRSAQLNVKLTAELISEIRSIATERDIMIAEVIELAMDALRATQRKAR